MKKVISAAVLVAFIGAVAFASLDTRNTTKQLQKKEQQKDVKKKKEAKRSCMFSAM
jgi:cell division protein FtsN